MVTWSGMDDRGGTVRAVGNELQDGCVLAIDICTAGSS